jgi:hypothetical protein
MGDMGEFWNDVRSFQVAKRGHNAESSTKILKNKGVSFESKNNGAHLIVENRFDFWPSTGLFIERKTNRKGRGVFNLLKLLNGGKA